MGRIAERWREHSGENNWKGLLDPLDSDLRNYIIHCGERVDAVGDAFNNEKASKGYGFSRYPMEHFFSNVGLENGNPYKYKVTKFFYARSEVKVLDIFPIGQSSWIGYVAVATDEGKAALGRRDILICWRGTMMTMEAINDLEPDLVSASDIFGSLHLPVPKVHHGWHSIYTSKEPFSLLPSYNKKSARDQVLDEVKDLVDLHKGEEISITVSGHSLGAALATLNAMDIVAKGYNKTTDNKTCLVTAIVFASPRVGDEGFEKLFSGLENLRVLRISNAMDIVPLYPFQSYSNVGQELAIDTLESPYLKINLDLKDIVRKAHQLGLYMHGIAGTQGSKGQFKLEGNLDIPLVNKSLDALKDKYNIPVAWWIEKNKGMIQQEDGSWKLDDYKPDPPTS